MTTPTPLAPKPSPAKKQDIIHTLFAASLIILIASLYSATKAAEVIREWAMYFFAIMFFVELMGAAYEHHQIKKQDRDIDNKRNAV